MLIDVLMAGPLRAVLWQLARGRHLSAALVHAARWSWVARWFV